MIAKHHEDHCLQLEPSSINQAKKVPKNIYLQPDISNRDNTDLTSDTTWLTTDSSKLGCYGKWPHKQQPLTTSTTHDHYHHDYDHDNPSNNARSTNNARPRLTTETKTTTSKTATIRYTSSLSWTSPTPKQPHQARSFKKAAARFSYDTPIPECDTSLFQHRCKTSLFPVARDLSGTPWSRSLCIGRISFAKGPRPKQSGRQGKVSAWCTGSWLNEWSLSLSFVVASIALEMIYQLWCLLRDSLAPVELHYLESTGSLVPWSYAPWQHHCLTSCWSHKE